jgi:hypothetical protein
MKNNRLFFIIGLAGALESGTYATINWPVLLVPL